MTTKGKFESGIATLYDSVTTETVQKSAPVVFYDDFLGADLVIPSAAESGCIWLKKIVNGGLAAKVAGVDGLAQLELAAADEAQSAYLFFNDKLVFSLEKGLVFEARAKISVLPTLGAELQIGVGCAYGVPDNMAYSAWFHADGDGLILCETDDAATDNTITSGITVLNSAYHIYKIDMSDVTSIKFYIDGVRVAPAATGANALMQPFIGLYKASSAGLGTIVLDYVKIWQKRS
jgi:hypothetical protein